MRHIALLGSTGSIGTNTLEIIARFPNEFKLIGLAGGENIPLLEQQIHTFQPQYISVKHKHDAEQLKKNFPGHHIFHGDQGLLELVNLEGVNTMVSAIDGTTALEATLASIKNNQRICLANKETLVAAGELISTALANSSAELIPIDSEQSAIFQCLNGEPEKAVRRVILTASGGPFYGLAEAGFAAVTVKQALNHPTWKMGTKITIDSATLMNKALEVIEAFYLFQLKPDQIDVVIHPQSIVHSMVEFTDSSILAQLSIPDMKLPILYSLSYPLRRDYDRGQLDITRGLHLEFLPVNRHIFRSIPLAFRVLNEGKNAGAILNAANEVAVAYFLREKITFQEIFSVVEYIFEQENFCPVGSVQDVIQTIDKVKRDTVQYIEKYIQSLN